MNCLCLETHTVYKDKRSMSCCQARRYVDQEVILWELWMSDYLRSLTKFVSTILNSIDMVMKSPKSWDQSERVHWKAAAWGPGSLLLQVQAEPRAVQSCSARLGSARASRVQQPGLEGLKPGPAHH